MDYFLFVILATLIISALLFTVRKFRKGGGCCGEHETVRRNRTANRRRANYHYCISLDIGGMTCENCAIRLSNALNQSDGIFAKVFYETKKAQVYSESPPDETAIRQAVNDAGYVVMAYSLEKCR